MDLATLRRATRNLVRGGGGAATEGPDPASLGRLSPAERAAFHTLQRRLERVGGELGRLEPVGGSAMWWAPARQAPVR